MNKPETMFKKMHLVSDDEFLGMKEKQLKAYDPELRSAAQLDTEINETLDRNDLNAEQKLFFLNSVQSHLREMLSKVQRHQPHYGDEVTKFAPKVEPKAETKADAKVETPKEELKTEAAVVEPAIPVAQTNLLKDIPKKHQESAKQLLSLLGDKGDDIGLSDKLEIVIDKHVIRDSNVQTILKALYFKRAPKNPPVGMVEFLDKIRDLQVPPDLVYNTAARQRLVVPIPANAPTSRAAQPLVPITHSHQTRSTRKQSGTGLKKHQPPGKRPKVLFLYRM